MMVFRQAWPLPSRPKPVIFIGAGAIVRTAHLPAYGRIGVPIAGVLDVNGEAAADTARQFDIGRVFETLDEACVAGRDGAAIFDVTVPGGAITSVLPHLPAGSAVLIQKPMGETLDEARAILRICRERQLAAAINFQLRFSPNVLALLDFVRQGALGAIVDIEVRLQVRQPWENWAFMRGAPRVEILYHSIHYLDTIRLLAGEPRGVYCHTASHPALPDFADTRTTTILDYGSGLRCSLALNHMHGFGPRHRVSMLKVEGTSGAAILSMGVNLDYPSGSPDTLEITTGGEWQSVALRGSWFTEAFEGPMSNMQRFVTGEDPALVSPVADAIRTMAVVEACYASSAAGGMPVPKT